MCSVSLVRVSQSCGWVSDLSHAPNKSLTSITLDSLIALLGEQATGIRFYVNSRVDIQNWFVV